MVHRQHAVCSVLPAAQPWQCTLCCACSAARRSALTGHGGSYAGPGDAVARSHDVSGADHALAQQLLLQLCRSQQHHVEDGQ
jgi:hypothetical protein